VAVGDKESTLFGRRDFLARGSLVCLSAAAVTGAALGLRALWPRAGAATALYVPAGRPEDYAVGQVSERLLAEHQLWVVRDRAGFYALSARCTHLGCKLRHAPGAGEYRCMCHGSFFSADGGVRRGPAARALERLLITLTRDGALLVDPSVRYRKERGEWDRPGAFVNYVAARGPR
jgi:cytochrome b6-f complex iron-sulfur subunit